MVDSFLQQNIDVSFIRKYVHNLINEYWIRNPPPLYSLYPCVLFILFISGWLIVAED